MRRALEAIVLAVLWTAPVPVWAASPAGLPDPALSRALDAVVMPVDAETRAFFGIPEDQKGALVLAVAQGGTAEVNGIRPGDIVVEVSGLQFALPDEIDAIVWAFMNDRKYSFALRVARDGAASTIAFPLVETHFQESYLVRDIPGWDSWSEWSRRSSQSWSAYASEHLDDFGVNFEGPPVCQSCGVPSAAAPEPPEAAESAAEVPPAPPTIAVETSTPDPEPPPVGPAPPTPEPLEANIAPGMLVPPVPDQPVLFDPPATAADAGDRAAVPVNTPVVPANTPAETENAPPAASAAIGDAPSATPVAVPDPAPVAIEPDPARIPRPAPERPALAAVGAPAADDGSGAPEPFIPGAAAAPAAGAIAPDAGMAVGGIAPDVQALPIEDSILNAAPAEATFGVADPDFCTRYPATCRMRELGYGDGRGDRTGGGSRGGGGGGGDPDGDG